LVRLPTAAGWWRSARTELITGGVFAVSRLVLLLAVGGARRSGDSVTYLPESLPTLHFGGNAVKLWTVPLFFRLAPTDDARMLLQHLIATAAWLLFAVALRSRLRHPSARVGVFVVILVLGLSQREIGWDNVMLSESLGLSFTVITAALWLLRDRLSLAGNLALGFASLLLMFARVSVLALPLLVGGTALWSAVRSMRAGTSVVTKRQFALLSVVVVGFGWLAIALPQQNESYRLRDGLGISYGGELAATLLWDRMLGDADSAQWLKDQGMPEPRGGIRPAPEGVDLVEWAVTWPPFLETAATDPEWRGWLDDQGSGLAVRWTLERPASAIRTLQRLAPSVLASSWEPGIIGYGDPTVPGAMAVAQPFFRGRGLVSDLTVLAVAAAVAAAVTRRRRAAVDRAALGDAVLLMAVAASALVIGVLFSGLEPTRHALPGPHLLRAALVMVVALLIDAVLVHRRELHPTEEPVVTATAVP